MKPKAAVYPYSKDDVQIFRYARLLKDFEPVYPVAPPGWGLAGRDATEIDGGQASGCKILSDLESALVETELLVLTSFKNYQGERGGFDATVALAGEKGQEALILELPDHYNETDLSKWCATGFIRIAQEAQALKLGNPVRYNLTAPVVVVFGEGPATDKFEVQLALRNELLNRGYRVTSVGSRYYSEIFGFHAFPSFMQSTRLSEAEKIIRLNHQLKIWENEENPDLVIVGVPFGIVPVTEEIHNNFGMTLLEVAAACQPELAINTLYHINYFPEFYSLKANFTLGKIGTATGCFVLSNNWLDMVNTKLEKKLNTVYLRKTAMPEAVPRNNPSLSPDIPVIPLRQPNAAGAIADQILAKLKQQNKVNFI